MRTISGAASSRATARWRAARAEWREPWAYETVPAGPRLQADSPLGMAVIGLAAVLVFASALLPFRFAPFRFALQSLIGLHSVEPAPQPDARIGSILFTPFDGNACRKVLFDNRTGRFGPDQHIRCYGAVADGGGAAPRSNVDRAALIKQAFTFPGAR